MTRSRSFQPLVVGERRFDWSRTYVMGIVNVTPDSFSDGGNYVTTGRAVDHALELANAGADFLDIGGESTRPGAAAVSADEEIHRVLPVIHALRSQTNAVISIDTYKACVAQAALAAGAHVVNDISGGLFDSAMLATCAQHRATFICGHLRGKSLADVHESTQQLSFDDVLSDLRTRIEVAREHIPQVIADPGIGFGKPLQTNLQLLGRSGELADALELPIMVGPSRKRFLGQITGTSVAAERDPETLGACIAALHAGAQLVRTHNVRDLSRALCIVRAVQEAVP